MLSGVNFLACDGDRVFSLAGVLLHGSEVDIVVVAGDVEAVEVSEITLLLLELEGLQAQVVVAAATVGQVVVALVQRAVHLGSVLQVSHDALRQAERVI